MDTSEPRAPRRIVLINGVYGAPEHFARLRECLAPDAVTDVFGFRRNGTPDPRGQAGFEPMVARLTEFLAEAVPAESGNGPVLLGFSLGGALSLEYALARPGAVSALVLVNAFSRFEGDFLQLGSIPALQMWPSEWTHPRLMARAVHRVEWMRRGLFHPDAPIETIEHGLRSASGTTTREDLRFQLAHLTLPEVAGKAARLAALAERMPILLVSSRDDLVVPPRHTQRLAVMMPSAQRLPPFTGGHAFFQHDGRALAEAVRAFLDRTSAAQR
jgi:pimeloyl-ACP methyl ester carboxylesterase